MTKSKKNPGLDAFFSKAKKWKQEMAKLRTIVLGCGLKEELKWYQPVYTIENNNVAIISGFKEYCVLSFFKGALLKDEEGILKKPGKNTQSARTIRFTRVSEIAELEPILKKYLREAVEAERAGLKVKFKKITEHNIPEELENKFDDLPELKTAFRSLTPGRQRGYLLYFSQPKQSKTRVARIEKCMTRILGGKGLND
jgi:uncharacterized protein YdeI (YjbR/CyaY-like superfamily)